MTYLKILTIIALASSLSLIIPIDSFAESEYVLSHFYSKGKLTSLMGTELATVWTIVDGDKGTVVSQHNGIFSVSRLDMNSYYNCGGENNIVCINGTITSVNKSDISNVGDTITMKYDVPNFQSFTFYDGPFAGVTLDLELSKFNAKKAPRIIDNNLDERIDDIEQKAYLRISEARNLVSNNVIQNELLQSNLMFYNLQDRSAEMEKRNQEWIDAKPDMSELEASILDELSSSILQQAMIDDAKKPTKYVIQEMILTNAYGVNIAQTGPTTDYIQSDESWWKNAKENGFDHQSGYDLSVKQNTFDISMRVISDDGLFYGVLKISVNFE